jgi:hypothetical protein
LGGQTLPPGCYAAVGNAAFGLTGNLILSGAGTYSFATPAAITTAASSSVLLINGAACSAVNWCIGAAATFGASSIFVGNVYTQQAITIGASVAIQGTLTAANAVITTGAGAVVSPCQPAFNVSLPANGCNCANPVSVPAQLGGQSLGPGCYAAVGGAAFGLTGALNLNGAGSYTFSTPAAITTAANSIVTLAGGATCAKVFWCGGAAVTFGASSLFVGVVSVQAAATLGAAVVVHGEVYSAINTVTMGAGALIIPC